MTDGVSLGNGKALAKSRTGLALHVEFAHERRWIPNSVLHDDSEVYLVGHEGNVVVNEWWADKEGLSDVKKKGRDVYGAQKKP